METRRVFVFIVAMGLFIMACRNIHDRDFWWHLRTGQLILQNHEVFHTDPFSFTRKGSPWINHEWLSEVLLYSLYRVAGFAGLMVTFAILSAATIYLAFLRSVGKPYIAAVVAIWGAAVAAPTWGVRPTTLSLLLAAVFLMLLEKSASNLNRLWWMVPLVLLWVNLHAEFALGIGLMLLYSLGISLDAIFGFTTWRNTRAPLKRLSLVTLASVAVVPLNPNGTKMYFYPLETLRSPAMQRYIDEWFSPNFHQHRHIPLLLMILGILVAIALSKRKLWPREILLLAFGTAAALHSVRHVGIFVIIVIPILSSLIGSALEGRALRSHTPEMTSTKLIVNGTILAVCVAFAAIRIRDVVRTQPDVEVSTLPAGAVNFIAANHPPGPLLNDYNWGGYLIWKLHPSYPVYIDGRADHLRLMDGPDRIPLNYEA